MHNRAFGVELEFDSNNMGSSGVGDLLWKNGFREDWVGNRTEHNNYYGERVREYNKIGYDGSEIEIRSPILRGKKGFDDLKRVVELLNNAGCSTWEEDGLHVHHDAPEFVNNKELVVKLLKSWKHNEMHISKFVDPDRAQYSMDGDSPCPTFNYNSILEYENSNLDQVYEMFERHNLNICSLREHGSIEFRFHEGTLQWPEIESWIRFGQSFLNGVISRKEPIKTATNPVVLMNRLKTNKATKTILAQKAGMSFA